jgi:hypothetical protein
MTLGGTKPSVLFHGTPLPGLQELRAAPGGVLYASDDMRLSSTFLADPGHCVCVRSSRGDVHAFIGERREEFVRRDRGGTIYILDAGRFSPSPPDVGLRRVWEWTTADAIKPMGSIVYASALTAMIALGVRIYFVTREFCENLRGAADAEASIGRHRCENDRFERYLYGVQASPAARGVGVGYAAAGD